MTETTENSPAGGLVFAAPIVLLRELRELRVLRVSVVKS